MTDQICAVDGQRPTPDGFVCASCASRAGDQLRAIAELVGPARLVAAGLVRRGSGGSGSNKPGSRSPANDDAIDALDEIGNSLTTIAREIADTRGLQTPRDGHALADPLTVVCSWLGGQLEWLRHAADDQGGAYAVAVFNEIGLNAARLRRLVDGPAPQRYLGPCGADIEIPAFDYPGECDGDVYARDGASAGRCRTCGAEWATAERRAWLDGEVRSRAFRASEIANAYGVNVKTIRSWAGRGHLVEHGHDRDGHPLYPVGDVLDLAAADAARRESARSERERRAATRVEDERLSA